jgi:pimeloyl-ACP methyl ester carboxylesterase
VTPLLLVHGLSGSARWWRPVCAPLAEGRDLHVLDVPRIHPRHAPGWLLAWLDGVGIGRADLVGHSLGGLICARAAARAPERVRKLVLVAPAGVPSGRRLLAHAAPLAAALAEAPTRVPRIAIDALRAGPGVVRSALYAATHDLRDELRHVAAPTLIVWGASDHLVPARLADDWLHALSSARLVRVPGGHVPMWDAPEELARAVVDFVEEGTDELGDEPRPGVVDGVRLVGDDDEPAAW